MSLDYGLKDIGVVEEDFFWDDTKCDEMINDERQSKWKEQREEDGFDEREMWALEHTISIFVYPRLKWFRDYVGPSFTPGSITSNEQWLKILDIMLFSFQESANGNKNEPEKERNETEDEYKRRRKIYQRKIKDSRIAFSKWFDGLWY